LLNIINTLLIRDSFLENNVNAMWVKQKTFSL
jgi:hypothetical protein